MELLEGAAAFAVVMIVLSTIVTGIVEAILRVLATRQEVLAKAVKAFFANEITPRFEAELRRAYDVPEGEPVAKTVVEKLAREMVLNPLAQTVEDRHGKATLDKYGWWTRLRDGIETLTTYSLLQRLAKTKFGAELMETGAAARREALTAISRTYERYVAASNEVFRTRAHVATAFIAMALCTAANIDAGRVFSHLIDDPAARAGWIERGEAANEAEMAARGRVEALIGKLEAGEAIEGFDVADLKAAIAAPAADVGELTATDGLPIGPKYYPYCTKTMHEGLAMVGLSDGEQVGACKVDRTPLSWAINVIVAGMLVSLGGPFWYRVFSSLSSLAKVARQMGGGGRADKIDKDAPGQPASAKALTGEDIAKTFETAQSGGAARAKSSTVA